jgi:regulatory protein
MEKKNPNTSEGDLDSVLDKLENCLLNYLSHKDRTVHELEVRGKRYLEKYTSLEKQEIGNLINKAIQHTKELGYVDDSAYAKTYIQEQKRKSLPRGPYYIRSFLFRKGVDRDLIDLSLDKYFSSEEEKEAVKQVLEKKSFKDRNKASQYLLRRGFSHDIVYGEVLRRYK